MGKINFKTWLVIIFVTSSGVKCLAHFFRGLPLVFSDAAVYYGYAQSILANGGLPIDYYWSKPAPLYPYLLAAAFSLKNDVNFFILLQILVTSLTPVVIALIGKKLKNEACGVIAGFIAVLSFDLVMYAVILFTESVFVLMISLIVLLLLKEASGDWEWKKYSYLGAFFGLLLLLKPFSILILLCFVLFFFVRYFFFNWANYRLKILIPFIFSTILVILPWNLVTNIHFNGLFFICPGGYGAIWAGWHSESNGGYSEKLREKHHPLPHKEPSMKYWKERLQQENDMKRELFQFLFYNPGKVFENMFRNFRKCFSVYSRDFSVFAAGLTPKNKEPPYTWENIERNHWRFSCVLWSLECYIHWLLAFCALLFFVDKKWIPVIIILGTGLAMGSAAHYEARYWIAARPAYILLSALTITKIIEYFRKEKFEISRNRLYVLGGILFLFALNEMLMFQGFIP